MFIDNRRSEMNLKKLAIAGVLVLVLWYLIFDTVIMDITLAIAGVLTGLAFCLVVIMVILPFYAGLLINKPVGTKKSGFHLFTTIEPGQVKIIERGKKFVRMVTDTTEKHYARTGVETPDKKNNQAYWQLLKDGSENPISDMWSPIRWWAGVVYKNTGLVFTGIYPFQRVREYDLSRTIIDRKEEKNSKDSNLVLRIKDDVSDHFRMRQFLFPMHITAAETQDKIPLDIIGVAEMEVTNPFQTAYGTDRWDHAMVNLVTDAINTVTKQMKLDQVLTAKKVKEIRMIADAVKNIAEDEITSGIQISNFRILEINPVLEDEEKKAIYAEALAIQKAKATVIDGEARAEVLTKLNTANEAGGTHAIESMQAEALVRAAEAAGKNGGSVILMPGSNGQSSTNDPTQIAILAELKTLNKRSS